MASRQEKQTAVAGGEPKREQAQPFETSREKVATSEAEARRLRHPWRRSYGRGKPSTEEGHSG